MKQWGKKHWIGVFGVGLVATIIIAVTALCGLNKKMSVCEVSVSASTRIDLFIMPDCPYGQDALRDMLQISDDMAGQISLKIGYIAHQSNRISASPIMQFVSLHGAPEVLKGLVAVTIEHLYPQKYLRYLKISNDNPGLAWDICAERAGVDKEIIATYIESPTSASLFAENIRRGELHGIVRSPTIYINGVMYTRNVDRDRLRMAICRADSRHSSASEGCVQLPECFDDADCAANAGDTPICQNRTCISLREPVVEISVLSSRLIAHEHLEPSLNQLAIQYPSMRTTLVYVEDMDGQRLAARNGVKNMPTFFVDHIVKTCRNYRWLIDRGAVPLENDDLMVHGSLVNSPFTSYGNLTKQAGRIVFEFSEKDRASALHAHGLLNKAEKLYQNVITAGGGDAEIYTNLGSLYGERGQMDLAIQSFRRAIEFNPDYIGAYSNLKSLYSKMSLSEGQQYALLQEGWAWCRQGAWTEAVRTFQEVLTLDKDIPSAHLGLGLANLRIGQVQDALSWLYLADQGSPDNPRVLNLLAGALWRMEQHDEAIERYMRALVLSPEDEQIRLNVANALHTVGDINAAVKIVEEGKDKGNGRLAAKQVELYYLLGRYDEASKTASASRIEGDAAIEILYWAAQADLSTGRLEVARERLLKCLARAGHDPGVSFRLGEAFLDCQMANQAQESFIKVITVLPGHARAHGYLAELYKKKSTSNFVAANDHYELACQFGLTEEENNHIQEKVSKAMDQ